MLGKTTLSIACPVAQTAEAVKQPIAYYNPGQEPGELIPCVLVEMV